MRIVSYYPSGAREAGRQGASGTARLGVVGQGGVLDVAEALRRSRREHLGAQGGAPLESATGFFAAGQAGLDVLQDLVSRAGDGPLVGALEDLDLAPTVPAPGKILCVGLNYRRHASESGMAEPKEPVLFSKFNNTLAPHGAAVNIQGLQQVDYESELALVIGKRGRDIAEADALGHVLGYLNSNDLSERELQMRSGQWLLGKTVDGFLPLGPVLVTADEAGDPQDMRVRGWLNGDLRQDSNTADMIFSVAEIIAYASRFMTLEPGDVILTGTPEGVVLGRPQKDWVVPGDVYDVEVGELGRLSTRFV